MSRISKDGMSASVRALHHIKLHCDRIIDRLNVRINDLEQFKDESPYACELFHSYSEARNQFKQISTKIDSIKDKESNQSEELLKQINKVNESFRLVCRIKINAPIDACFNYRKERKMFVETRRGIGRCVYNIQLAMVKLLHLQKHTHRFFAKASINNENPVKKYCNKAMLQNEKMAAKLGSVDAPQAKCG
jgi:hypothetical protein